jgi:hypothetical protein
MPVLPRRALYERIWAAPVRTVAQELGISDVGLRKICQKAQIPLPERGYWTRLRAGKSVKAAALPPRGPGTADRVRIGEAPAFYYWRSDPEAELAEPAPDEPVFEETIEDVRARVAAQVGSVRIERNLASPHPLVRRLLADDETRRLKPASAPWRLMHCEPLFASDFERRRLRVLSTLFTAVQECGGQAWASDEQARQVGVVIGGEQVRFHLDHPSAKPDRAGRWTTRPGWADVLRLTLEVGGELTWSDGEESALEAHLTEIVVQLIVAGEMQYRATALSGHAAALRRRRELAEELARRRAEAARQARVARIEAEHARRSELMAMAADFRAAQDIRALVAQVSEGCGDEALGRRWRAWALEVADRLDPSSRLISDEAGSWRLAEPEWPAAKSGEAERNS